MADEILRSKHGFGNLSGVQAAIEAGKLDEFDIVFLDGDSKPKVGWIDKNGIFRLVDNECVVVVDSLPTSGVEGKVYIYNDESYFWDGTKFTNLCKPTDLSGLESHITEIETEMETKVDATTVKTMIEEYTKSGIEVVEF